jgi:hypothetical protein
LLIDGLHGDRPDHETVVVHDGQLFVPLLVFMA